MSKLKISEDWTSTIVGWFIILLVVFQLKPNWPSFSWLDADALSMAFRTHLPKHS